MPVSRKTDKWKNAFQQMVETSLRNSIALVENNASTPQAFRPHLDSMTSQIRWGNRFFPELALQLVVAAYPWPVRWGRTDSWRDELEQVRGELDASHPLHRQSQACLADILQFTGQPEKIPEIAGTLFSDPSIPPGEFVPLVVRAGGAWLSALASQGKVVEVEQAATGLWDQLEAAAGAVHPAQLAKARAIILHHQSIAARRRGDLPQAVELISRAIEELEDRDGFDHSDLIEIIQSRAIYHWVGGNYPAALADLDYAQNISLAADDHVGLCSIHGNCGLVYWSMSEFDKSEVELLEAIQLAERNKLVYLLMKQVGNLGMVYFNRGDLPGALRYIDREFELAEISNDLYEKALAEGNRAAVQVYTDQPERALSSLFSSLQKYRDTERFETLVGVLVDLSVCHYRIGDLERSARFAEQAYQLAQDKDNSGLILIALRARALSAPASEAIGMLKTALDLADQLDRKLDIAGCKIFLAHLEVTHEDRDRLWDEAVSLLKMIGATKWIEDKSAGDAVIPALTV